MNMEDIYRQTLKAMYGEHSSEEQIEEKLKELLDKQKSVKTGPNVIHLNYIKGLIDIKDLEQFESKFKNQKIEFSSYDKSGVPYNSFEEITVLLLINEGVLQNLLYGASGSALWDVIKDCAEKISSSVIGKKHNKISGGKIIKEKSTFSLEHRLDKNTSFLFKIEADFENKELFLNAMDKTLEFVKEQTKNETFQHPVKLSWKEKLDKWVKDIEDKKQLREK
ncbi:hypothetical protein [Aureispira anguillae]|uniref:Uncharacterized protein n=1 Tax=Aureispira anguillae TaxID=2864201 RepID=A0A915YD20_9BACT|nr:hypothetical protein [Aureispira anguillae]BDS10828.1 hypothetical protein AsAng_0015380 [Aureispira anguillae]